MARRLFERKDTRLEARLQGRDVAPFSVSCFRWYRYQVKQGGEIAGPAAWGGLRIRRIPFCGRTPAQRQIRLCRRIALWTADSVNRINGDLYARIQLDALSGPARTLAASGKGDRLWAAWISYSCQPADRPCKPRQGPCRPGTGIRRCGRSCRP